MNRAPLNTLLLAMGLATTTGCHSMTTDSASHSGPAGTALRKGPEFRTHAFGAYCYDTQGCRITYGDRREIDQPDHASGPRPDEATQRKVWAGHHIVQARPQTATIEWKARDGTPLHAEIDLGHVFADGRIVHRVPPGEIAHDASFVDPAILLVVDDRTVEVYMRALVPLNHLRDPANRYSDSVDEPVLVMRRTY